MLTVIEGLELKPDQLFPSLPPTGLLSDQGLPA